MAPSVQHCAEPGVGTLRYAEAFFPRSCMNPGTRVGPYVIVEQIGAGGMGEVYRARDTRLGRDVAVKTLSDSFARDPERLARFEREARLLAALNHPHVGAIYGIEDAGGTPALVLELVEGQTLQELIEAHASRRPAAAALGSDRHRRTDRRRPRRRAREGHRPPRPEARQRQAHARGCREGARLRTGPRGDGRCLASTDVAATRRSPPAAPTAGTVLGTARLHEPRAGARRRRSTSAPTSGRSAASSSRC